MGIGALFEHENHRGTGLKLIADRFLLLIVRKMLDVTHGQAYSLQESWREGHVYGGCLVRHREVAEL